MSVTTRPARVPQFSPRRNGPCLCGSGLKFKRCCADRLRSDHNYDLRSQAFLEEGKFKEALYESRAHVTQYTIWHKSHTEPVIRRGLPQGDELLEVDIRALAVIVDNLMFSYIKADMMDEFPAVLERLRGNINHSDWQRKVTYLHALHALWPDWDIEAGRRELKKLGSVADDKDEEILQLYLDLLPTISAFPKSKTSLSGFLPTAEALANGSITEPRRPFSSSP